MYALDLAAFSATALVRQPFEYLIVPGFIRPEARAAINADFPRIETPGSFPASELTFGPAFRSLIEALQDPEVRWAFAEKFQIDLNNRPTMITVRGRCGTRDGHIHTDTVSKIITALIYMNSRWEQPGGRLRLLRSARNIDDVIVEIPPMEGTLVAFRRSDNSFHGHKPFIGGRRVIQLNWVTGRGIEFRELFKHRASAWLKRLLALSRYPFSSSSVPEKSVVRSPWSFCYGLRTTDYGLLH
jgi:SM-20-related protein